MALRKEGIPRYVINSVRESLRECELKNPYDSPAVKNIVKKYQGRQSKKQK
jgi:hypothetical protein